LYTLACVPIRYCGAPAFEVEGDRVKQSKSGIMIINFICNLIQRRAGILITSLDLSLGFGVRDKPFVDALLNLS